MTWDYALFWLLLAGGASLYIGDHINTLAAAIRDLGETLKGKR